METLEDRIHLEYYRLASKLGVYPDFIHVNPNFINYLINKYPLFGRFGKEEDTYQYMGMDIKRSLDIKEDEFILSFNKYNL